MSGNKRAMNSGFTLVEMAVGLLITGFLLLSAGSVYFIAIKIQPEPKILIIKERHDNQH